MMFGRRSGPALACAAGALVLAGCGSGSGAGQGPEAEPHGRVEGAEETAEPQWRLVMADTADGAVHMLDPATEEVTGLGEVPGAAEAATDGRFAYLGTGGTGGTAGTGGTGGTGAVTVLDSGAWTVDHGDHVHYYRAEPGPVGEAQAGGGLRALGGPAVTALSSEGGPLVLDRSALDDGAVEEAASPDGGAVLPYAGKLLVTGADGDAVEVLDRDGGSTGASVGEPCPDAAAQAVTRRGAVLGCSDGALLVTEDDGVLDAEKVPYPDAPDGEDAPPVEAFDHRPGAAVLAGAAGGDGGDGVWVFDAGAAEWTFNDSGPAVAVSAAGEDMPVLVLGEDGALSAYDPASGERTAETGLMDPPGGDGPAPAIRIDTARAYVSDPEADAVHEIDHNDDLRLARTFDLEFSPDLMVETGW